MKAHNAVIGSRVDLLFSFDATGSMASCIEEVKETVEELVRRMFGAVPGLRVGVIAHKDYCDADDTYVTRMLDLTDDKAAICSWIRRIGYGGGGDSAECYEAVLHEARSASWRAGAQCVLVLLGDDIAHPASYPLNREGLDWRNEAAFLQRSGIRVYAVQCLNREHATSFYKELARVSGGLHLRLDQFRHVETLLLGVAFKQGPADVLGAYEKEVRGRGQYSYGVESIFDTLAGRSAKVRRSRSDGLVPVDPALFQVFEVRRDTPIRDFVERRGIAFEKGCGFYPHTERTELIQERKEVILEDLATGELFSGAQAREMIGLPLGVRGEVRPNPLPGFCAWVQSTSVNRKLRKGTKFMYRLPDKG